MKKDLRIIKTEKSIQRALLAILKTKQLEEITVAELCREAEINRGTFYSHYKDVFEAFMKYLFSIIEDLRISFKKPYTQSNKNLTDIEPDMIEIFNHVYKYRDFYSVIFHDKSPIMYYLALFQEVQSLVKESIKGYYNENDFGVKIDYLASYNANAILGMLMEWNKEGYRSQISDLNEQLMHIFRATDLKSV